MIPPYSWSTPGRKPGTSTNVTSGMLKASHVRTNRAAFSADSMSSTPASTIGWLPTMPTVRPSTPPEPAQDRARPVREVLHELAVVDDRLDDLVHVVGQVRAGRQQVAQLRAQPLGVVVGLDRRGLLHVVLREVREQVAHVVEARLLVGGDERGDAGLRGVAHRPAELLQRDVLAGHRLHDVGAGDEHVRRLADHEDEVGHRRRVHGAAGARARGSPRSAARRPTTARCGRRSRRSWRG